MLKFALAVGLIGGALLYTYYSKQTLKSLVQSEQDAERGTFLSRIPEVSYVDSAGSTVSLSAQVAESKQSLIHFWATWCAPCEVEFPDLVELASKTPETQFIFVAINDSPQKVQKFMKRFAGIKMNFKVLFDNSDLYFSKFGSAKVPESFFVSSDGKVIRRFLGPQEWNNPYYLNFFNKQLKSL